MRKIHNAIRSLSGTMRLLLVVVVTLMAVQMSFLYLASSGIESEKVHVMPHDHPLSKNAPSSHNVSNSSTLAFRTTHQSHNDALVFPGKPRKLKIAHVINLYPTIIEVENDNNESQLYPLRDQAQTRNVTKARIKRARAKAASRLNGTNTSQLYPRDRARNASLARMMMLDQSKAAGANTSQFHPLDQAQNVTIASMTRARANAASRLDITLYSAIFPGEDHIVPDGFEKFYLNRSTMTEYPNLDKGKGRKLPFIQDIFQGVCDIADFDYFIYTNADIGLHESFYNVVASIIDKGFDSFTINRRTLPKTLKEQELTGNDLDLIFEMIPEGSFHPGMDCFIIHRDVMPRVTLGDMFMGYPPWGRALENFLAHTAKKHTTYFSDLNATFHLGNDLSWSEKNSPSVLVNMELKDFLEQCTPIAWRFNQRRPMRSMTPYRLQNTKNCATVFASINKSTLNSTLWRGLTQDGNTKVSEEME